MIKFGKTLAAACVIGLLVVGAEIWAQQQPEPLPRREARRAVPSQSTITASGERKSAPAIVVDPPDLVLVEVLEALPGRPISGERLVRPDGTISLGFYGNVHVAGLTLPEVKERIVLHLKQFLSDPNLGLVELDEEGDPVVDPATGEPKKIDPKDSATVFVDVTAYNSKAYYVQGDVLIVGKLPYTGGETVLDALSYCGGLLPSADPAKIRLIRSFPEGVPVQVLPIDYEEITMGTDSSTNYQIRPGDRLVVPRHASYGGTAPKSIIQQQARRKPGEAVPGNSYYPEQNLDPGDREREALRGAEKHLGEVEKKLDTLIEALSHRGTPARKDRATKGSQTRDRKSEKEPVERNRP